jgi:glycosyl transferase family 25
VEGALKTFVISLELAKERREHMARQLARTELEWSWYDAVDGRRMSDAAIASVAAPVWEGRGKALSGGIVGCALSHLGVYEAVLEGGWDRVLVLEDDVLLAPSIAALAEEASDCMGDEPEAILLQASFSERPCGFWRDSIIRLGSGSVVAAAVDPVAVTGTGAYVINHRGCEKMLIGLRPIRVQADGWDYFIREGLLRRVRCVLPLPVDILHWLPSTIDHGYYSWRDHVYTWLDRRSDPISRRAMAYRRQRFHRRDRDYVFVE